MNGQAKASTLVGMVVMDAIDAGQIVTVYIHGYEDDAHRERILGQLVDDHGFTRNDSPGNNDGRGANGHSHCAVDVHLWPRPAVVA
jgi:hypothetical protein